VLTTVLVYSWAIVYANAFFGIIGAKNTAIGHFGQVNCGFFCLMRFYIDLPDVLAFQA